MKNSSRTTWQRVNATLLILSYLTMFLPLSQAQNGQGQSDRLKLIEKKPEDAERTSSQRMSLNAANPNAVSGSGRLEFQSQRLQLVRSTVMEYNQQLKIQQVGEIFASTIRIDDKPTPVKAIETPIAKAERLLKQGDIAQAKEICNKLIADNSKDYRARSAMAYILLQEGETELALKDYEEITKSYNDTETTVNYGVALYRTGRIKEATEQYIKAIEKNKNLPVVHFNLAMSYAHLGDSTSAIDHYELALKQKNNKYPEAANNLGLVYEALGEEKDRTKAMEYFKVAVQSQSSNTHIAHYNLARQYSLNKDYEKAIVEFNEAIKKKSDFPEAYLSLGNLYFNYGQVGQTPERGKELLENAIKSYKTALEQRKNIYPLAHENLAIALTQNNQKEDAYSHFSLAVEQYGEHCSQTISNLLAAIQPKDASVIFLVYNERSRPGNPGNLVFKGTTGTTANQANEIPANNINNEQDEATNLKLVLKAYENTDEDLKNLAKVRYCGAQAYLASGDIIAAMEEITMAAKLCNYKDPKIMQAFLLITKPVFVAR